MNAQQAHRSGGFTLVELSVAAAILSVLVALGISGLSSVGRATAPQTAAWQLSAHLSQARSIATERSMDVWVIFFETLNKTGGVGSGQGGYIVLQDPDFTFGGLTPAPVAGEWRYATMPIPNCTNPTVPTAGRVKVLQLVCFQGYSGANAQMANVGAAITATAPFLSLNPINKKCSFCSGANARGAMVFQDNGQTSFVDGSGTVLSARSGYVGFSSLNGNRSYLFAVAGPTSFVQNYAK